MGDPKTQFYEMYPAEYNILQIATKSTNTYNIVLFDKFNEE